MDYKKTKAPTSTITRDVQLLEQGTNNIYESIAIIAKRADQIERDLKTELNSKLEEFASVNDTLEETFENREQIEISKFYEKLPNPVLIAIQEYLDDQIYFRKPETEEDEDINA
jgi:DNA-directed RNA polymerase subunit K/omega